MPFGMGSINVGPGLVSLITAAIIGIFTLTIAPQVGGGLNAFTLLGDSDGYCRYQGEALDRLSPARTGTEDAEATWDRASTHNNVTQTANATTCSAETAIAEDAVVYTPQGKSFTAAAAVSANAALPSGFAWHEASESLTTGALASIVSLLFGVMALLLVVGAFTWISALGANLVRQQFGGAGAFAAIIVGLIGLLVLTQIIPEILTPFDRFVQSIDGNRYAMYETGLGALSATLAPYMGIIFIISFISIGTFLWRRG